MEEWKEYSLSDIVNLVIDYRGKTPLKLGGSWSQNGYRALSAKNIKTGAIVNEDSIRFVDDELYLRLMKDEVQRGDIFVTSEAPFGQIYYWNSDEKIVLSQRLFCLRLSEEVCSKFVYYYMITNTFQAELDGRATGTTVIGLRQPELLKCKINLPSLAEQQRIASILSSLDEKIEVNRRINDNLEQQAQALFKSWFVDFEPFRDQPFVESELGMIPEGWRVGRYEEIIEMTISGDWGKEKREGKYVHKVACIRGCDFQDIKNGLRGNTPERYILEKNYQSKHFHHNDVLVEISGGTQTVSTGRVCPVSQLLIDKFNADIVCTNFCRVIRPIAAYAAYLYYSWLYKYNGKVMFGYENGTSGIKNFRIKDFISVEPVVIPPADLLGKFQQFVDSVQLQIQTRGSESTRLVQLRDTLLPRLLSGELNVNEITA